MLQPPARSPSQRDQELHAGLYAPKSGPPAQRHQLGCAVRQHPAAQVRSARQSPTRSASTSLIRPAGRDEAPRCDGRQRACASVAIRLLDRILARLISSGRAAGPGDVETSAISHYAGCSATSASQPGRNRPGPRPRHNESSRRSSAFSTWRCWRSQAEAKSSLDDHDLLRALCRCADCRLLYLNQPRLAPAAFLGIGPFEGGNDLAGLDPVTAPHVDTLDHAPYRWDQAITWYSPLGLGRDLKRIPPRRREKLAAINPNEQEGSRGSWSFSPRRQDGRRPPRG